MSAAVVPVRRAALAFIFITVLLDILAFGMIIPVLPHLIASFLDDNLSRAAVVHGLFASCFMVMQFLFSPVQGALSDDTTVRWTVPLGPLDDKAKIARDIRAVVVGGNPLRSAPRSRLI